MNPFRLQIQLDKNAAALRCQWFGLSGGHAADSSLCRLKAATSPALAPDSYTIDLRPLLAEIASSARFAEKLEDADEFLLLRILLEPSEFQRLIRALASFLQQKARSSKVRESVRAAFPPSGRAEQRIPCTPDRRTVRVWYGTDRKRLSDDVNEGFSKLQSNREIVYGACDVFIPQSHKPGSVGSPWWRRWWAGDDDRLTLKRTIELPQSAFWSTLAETLKNGWPTGERNIFVFIHGYNVSFEDAALRAAQLGYDLKLPGEIAFYSWPARGMLGGYFSDGAAVSSMTPHLAQFLHELNQQTDAERVHLFVHSMGNRGILNALERLRALSLPDLQLGQVFFCAPDEDVSTFQDKALAFPHRFENRTLLVCSDDIPLAAAQWLHDRERAGLKADLAVDDMETIEVRGLSCFNLGHGYFAEAAAVISDMREAVETKRRAAERKIPQPLENRFVIDVRRAADGQPQ